MYETFAFCDGVVDGRMEWRRLLGAGCGSGEFAR